MNFLKVASRDIKSIFKNRLIRVSVIAIIVVPLLYSLLYLDAFWDPYSRLQDLPVAVVNNDVGVTVDGEKSNFGNDLVKELKGNTQIGWKFTDENDANSGLEGNKYYAKFVIPSDFSQKVISAKEGKPEIARLQFSCNEKKNFLSAQINSKVESELRQKIVESVTKSYVSVSFDKLYEIKDKMGQAADGSTKIYNGIETLNSKIPELEKGAVALGDGSEKLYNGQVKLQNAIVAMNSGLSTVNSKVPELKDGMNKLYDGSKALSNGTKDASSSATALANAGNKLYYAYDNQVYKSVKELRDGANRLNGALSQMGVPGTGSTLDLNTLLKSVGEESFKVQELGKKLNGLLDNGSALSSKVNSSITSLEKVISSGDSESINKAVKELKDYQNKTNINNQEIGKLRESLKSELVKINKINSEFERLSISSQGSTLKDAASQMEQLKAGVAKLSSGLNALEYGLNENNEGSFGSGMKGLNENMGMFNQGINKINAGATSLSKGLESANQNIPMLSNGLSALYSGSSQMLDGSNSLVSGQGELNSGISKLTSSVPEMKEGTQKLTDGSKELSEKLTDGKKQLTDGLINSSEDMGDFVASPINIENAPINPVPNYGTGFAPYFISLSLWIGAIMMFFVIPSKTADDENTSKFAKVFGKFLSFGFVGILQALLVGFVVMRLGLNPTNKLLYYLSIIFFSLVFIAMVQCFIFLLGDAGRLLSIVLLILQLTACAGTFPLEVVPGFFKVINPYMPFTYTVDVLREVISATTINYSVIYKDTLILFIVMVVFLIISITLKNVGERIQESIEGRKKQAIVTCIEDKVNIAK
ncbi:MAG: YhgE/Pip domain-containing protein [Clostridium sp.]